MSKEFVLTGAPAPFVTAGAPVAADWSHAAVRTSIRPLDHVIGGRTLGHYYVGGGTGSLAGAIASNSTLAWIRWADATSYFVLIRLAVTIVSPAVSSPVFTSWSLSHISGTTAAAAGAGSTVLTPSRARQNMSPSLLTASGEIRVAGTGGLSINGIGDTSFMSAGGYFNANANAATSLLELYQWRGLGQHPVVLGQNEALQIQTPSGWAASNTQIWFFVFEWAEVAAF